MNIKNNYKYNCPNVLFHKNEKNIEGFMTK